MQWLIYANLKPSIGTRLHQISLGIHVMMQLKFIEYTVCVFVPHSRRKDSTRKCIHLDWHRDEHQTENYMHFMHLNIYNGLAGSGTLR